MCIQEASESNKEVQVTDYQLSFTFMNRALYGIVFYILNLLELFNNGGLLISFPLKRIAMFYKLGLIFGI